MPAKREPDGLPRFLCGNQKFFASTKKPYKQSEIEPQDLAADLSALSHSSVTRMSDPKDPLYDSIENLTVGMSLDERAEYLIDLVNKIDQQPKPGRC
jgi:hypothetical protein